MRSIKPGRGQSGMSFMGSVIGIIFGVFWTVIAFSITSNSAFGIMGTVFPLFGVLFIIMGVAQAYYNYKNATGKNRYSLYDITDSSEEGDPSDKWIKDDKETEEDVDIKYCPYCGASLEVNFSYCPKCGKNVK